MDDSLSAIVATTRRATEEARETLDLAATVEEAVAGFSASIASFESEVEKERDRLQGASADLRDEAAAHRDALATEIGAVHEELGAFAAYLAETRERLGAALEAAHAGIDAFEHRVDGARAHLAELGEGVDDRLQRAGEEYQRSEERAHAAAESAMDAAHALGASLRSGQRDAGARLADLAQMGEATRGRVQNEASALARAATDHHAQLVSTLGEVGRLLGEGASGLQERIETLADREVRQLVRAAFDALDQAIRDALRRLEDHGSELGEIRRMLSGVIGELDDTFGHVGDQAVRSADTVAALSGDLS